MSGLWDRWWELPGPNRLVRSLALALQEGSSVVLGTPDYTPPGLDAALEKALKADSRVFHRLTVPQDIPPTPGGYLQGLYCTESPGDQLPSARNLARDSSFGGRFIWLAGLTDSNAKHWSEFVANYSIACRTEPEWRRTAFILLLPAKFALPPEDIALVCRTLSDLVNPLDMQLFTAQLLRDEQLSPHHYALSVAAITKLSAFDPLVALALAQDPLAAATNPYSCLQSVANERDWGTDTPIDWRIGTAGTRGGTTVVHSSLLMVKNGHLELKRRLWSAQLEVYFPLLEQRRRQLLTELDSVLLVPYQAGYTVIRDKADLELGHIHAQISQGSVRVSSEIRTQVSLLRDLRNTLAHFTPVPTHDLLNPQVEAAFERVWGEGSLT